MASEIDRALVLLQTGRVSDARAILVRLLASDPYDSRLLTALTHCWVEENRAKEALKTGRLAVASDPNDPYACHALARAYAFRGNPWKAIRMNEESIRLDSSHVEFFALRARLCVVLGRYREAFEAANVGLRLNPNDESCLSSRIECLVADRRLEAAEMAANRAIGVDPSSSNLVATRARVLLEKGDIRESETAFRDALRLRPNDEENVQGYRDSVRSRFGYYRFSLAIINRIRRLPVGARLALLLPLAILPKVTVELGRSDVAHSRIWFGVAIVSCVLILLLFSADSLVDFIQSFVNSPSGAVDSYIVRSRWILVTLIVATLACFILATMTHATNWTPTAALLGFSALLMFASFDQSQQIHRRWIRWFVLMFSLCAIGFGAAAVIERVPIASRQAK